MPQKIYSYTVIFEPAEEGGYNVYVPALPGCFTQGETFEEAMSMAKEAIEGHLEALRNLGEPIPVELADPVIEKVAVRLEMA